MEKDDQKGFQNKDTIPLESSGIGYGGIDILLVVDNSEAYLLDAQYRLATEVYAFIRRLMSGAGDAQTVHSIRIAATTANMGLQYGGLFRDVTTPRAMKASPSYLEGCDGLGDNGRFLPIEATTVVLGGGRIPCELYGENCPDGWRCESGFCHPPVVNTSVVCNSHSNNYNIVTTSNTAGDPALDAACLAVRGTRQPACPVVQPLEAALKALHSNEAFLVDSHLLVVFVLSGRDDCSISDGDLLLPENGWGDPSLTNVICHRSENTKYLFEPQRYFDELVKLKDGDRAAVFFGAVVGAAAGYVCSGNTGAVEMSGCLVRPEMQLNEITYVSPMGFPYQDYAPACRLNVGDVDQVGPKPSPRLVTTAALFEERGYVQSMCDPSWAGMMDRIASNATSLVSQGECLTNGRLITAPLSETSTCTGCVAPECDLYVEFVRKGDDVDDYSCPNSLVYGSNYAQEAGYKKAYEGEELVTRVFCPIRNIATPLSCRDVKGDIKYAAAGWYYCENGLSVEGTEYSCGDGVDNDNDGMIDCADVDTCSGCAACGGESASCSLGCPHDIVLNDAAKRAIGNNALFLQCPFR